MRGRRATRTIVVLAFTWVVAPLLGQDSRGEPVEMDLEMGLGVGRMPLLRPGGCGGPHPRDTAGFLGGQGQLVVRSRPSSGPWQHRLEGTASGDLRIHSIGESEVGLTGLGRGTIGWSSRYLGISLGAWLGNTNQFEELMGFASGAIRLGTPDRHLRLSVFDQPGCYPALCLVGLEGLWTFERLLAIQLGGSLGLVGGRGWLRVPFLWLGEEAWLIPGLEIATNDERELTWALTLGVRLPEL
ncbi:MAG: hypothetical protein P1V51_02180 [Deltaproteobacteria bacterium]|nr:hypothetical protein [Deltaproteobacteria bacterium]